MITRPMRNEDQLRQMLADAREELAMVSDEGGSWANHEGSRLNGLMSVCRWFLGEGPSPIYGYNKLDDVLLTDEWRTAQHMVIEDGDLSGRDPQFVHGVHQGYEWARTTSDEFIGSPLEIG